MIILSDDLSCFVYLFYFIFSLLHRASPFGAFCAYLGVLFFFFFLFCLWRVFLELFVPSYAFFEALTITTCDLWRRSKETNKNCKYVKKRCKFYLSYSMNLDDNNVIAFSQMYLHCSKKLLKIFKKCIVAFMHILN